MSILNQLYQRMRTSDQMDERFCQCCLSPLEDQTDLFTLFLSDEFLCRDCASQLEKSRKKIKKSSVKITGLLLENDFLLDLLDRYRRRNDRALGSLFLRWSRPWQFFFLRFVQVGVMACPQEEYIKKGYDPLAELFTVHHIPVIRLYEEKEGPDLLPPARITILAGWNEKDLDDLMNMAKKLHCSRILLISQKQGPSGDLKKYLRFNRSSPCTFLV